MSQRAQPRGAQATGSQPGEAAGTRNLGAVVASWECCGPFSRDGFGRLRCCCQGLCRRLRSLPPQPPGTELQARAVSIGVCPAQEHQTCSSSPAGSCGWAPHHGSQQPVPQRWPQHPACPAQPGDPRVLFARQIGTCGRATKAPALPTRCTAAGISSNARNILLHPGR